MTTETTGTDTRGGISHKTLINERLRGRTQGERDLLARTGAASAEELITLVEEAKRRKASGAAETSAAKGADGTPAVAQSDIAATEKLIAKLLDDRLAPITKRFADEEAAKTSAQKAAEEKAIKDAEEAEAEAEAQKAIDRDWRWFKKVARGVGAEVDDAEAYADLQAAYDRRIKALSEEDFEDKFGDDVDDAEKAKNAQEILAAIRKRSPGLFKAEESSAEEVAKKKAADEAAAAAAALKPGNTGKPAGTAADKATAAGAVAGGVRDLDYGKLSPKQKAEYNRDPKGFRTQFHKGLIDYEQPAGKK